MHQLTIQSNNGWVPTSAQLDSWIASFERDGFIVLRGLLSADEILELRERISEAFGRPDPGDSTSTIIRDQMFLRGRPFEELIDRSPVIDFVEKVLGQDCHLIAENAIHTRPGEGLDRWHVDDTVHFPRPRDVLLDPCIPMPCFVVQALYYLVDVDEEIGPTEFVPGTHRSGREPDLEPTYEGQGPVSILARAGDCTLQNGQTWHRGATNLSRDRIRIVQEVGYGRRFIAQRFYPFVNFHMPEDLLARSSQRRRRLLGVHPRGPYSRGTYM
jgi:ectoine hydroxylase-related dioxygenase (phytanoyl-CoA dioxygenase family)